MTNSKEYNKNYYQKNREIINSKRKKQKKVLTQQELEDKKKKNKDRIREYNYKYYIINGYSKNYTKKQRIQVIKLMGGKCVKCLFNDIRALQIDHINGGGSKERRAVGFSGTFYSNVINSFNNNENKYQLLCANCNWIKRFENKECLKSNNILDNIV